MRLSEIELVTKRPAAGRCDEAITALREALDRYERKQIIPLARRVRDWLGALQETLA